MWPANCCLLGRFGAISRIRKGPECCSIFHQIALSLAIAEAVLEFETRDLHAGNILVERCPDNEKIHMSLFAQNGVSDNGDYQYDVYRMMKTDAVTILKDSEWHGAVSAAALALNFWRLLLRISHPTDAATPAADALLPVPTFTSFSPFEAALLEKVRRMTREELRRFDADRTGIVDYALKSSVNRGKSVRNGEIPNF
ncbi:hypothetical protein niasHT_008196 [Heterodera trifolii]|uniref:Protein kinase domain-containing protein n=1 Tax=Heterodera trifolii TaxID=157864 RepID=A0ABD2LUK1_9BILA